MSLQDLSANQWFVNLLLDFTMSTLKAISALELFLIVIPVKACPQLDWGRESMNIKIDSQLSVSSRSKQLGMTGNFSEMEKI